MPVGKQIGKLSIRVLPDATKFREDIKKVIKRVEATMAVNLNVRANTDEAKKTVERFRQSQQGRKINMQLGINTAAARAQLTVFRRARTLPLNLEITKGSLAKVTATLAALSGGRLVGNILDDVARGLSNIDKNLPKIALVATGLTSLVSVLLAAGTGVITLAGDLAKMGNVLLVLPALLTGMGVALATIIMAAVDGKDYLGELAPAFRELQDAVSLTFWQRASEPILRFVNSVLPQLREGFVATADALGQSAAALSGAFERTFANGVLLGMFQRLQESILVLNRGSEAFAESITTIGTVGSSYLPRLSEWVVRIGDQFNSWLQTESTAGNLQKYIEDGITQVKLFGAATADLVRFLKGIDEAATDAGAGGLRSLAENLRGAAEVTNSPAFQTTLTTLLKGATAGVDGLGVMFDALGRTLERLAPVLSGILANVGTVVGNIGGQLADVLGSPVFARGLSDFFDGLLSGITSIGPALPALAEGLAAVGSFAGELAAQLGPVLATAIQSLVPALISVLDALLPLVPILSDALVESLPGLSLSFIELVEAVAPLAVLLAELVATALPGLVVLVRVLTPAIAALLQTTEVYEWALAMLQAAQDVLRFVSAVLDGTNQAQIMLDVFSGKFGESTRMIMEALLTVRYGIVDAFEGIVGAIQGAMSGVTSVVASIRSNIASLFANPGEWLRGAGQALIGGFIEGIRSMIGAARAAASNVVQAIADFFPHSPAKEGPFSGRGWTLYSGRALTQGFATGIGQGTASVKQAALDMVSSAVVPNRGIDAGTDYSGAARDGGGGYGNQITVMGDVGYSPKAIADEIDLKKRQAALAAGIPRVGVV